MNRKEKFGTDCSCNVSGSQAFLGHNAGLSLQSLHVTSSGICAHMVCAQCLDARGDSDPNILLGFHMIPRLYDLS